MPNAQTQIERLKELDRLYIAWERNQSEENRSAYQTALAEFRGETLKGFWRKSINVHRGIRLYDALTLNPASIPIDIVVRWQEMVLDVQRQIGTLDDRLAEIQKAIDEKRAAVENEA